MAKPNEAKDIKPKTEGEEKAPAGPKLNLKIDENMKVIIINLATTILVCILFLSITYVMMSNLLSSKLANQPTTQATTEDGGDAGAAGDDTEQKGAILDLGEFIVNLSDVAPRKYLKADVALEVSSKPEDVAAAPKGEHGGGGASPFDTEMEQYKPALRDAVITTLSSKTSAELSTVAGKELAKQQITESVNGIFAGNRDVMRVSFGEFIIQ